MEKNKSLPFVIGGVVLVVALFVVFLTNNKKDDSYKPSIQNSEQKSDTQKNDVKATYTLTDVTQHNLKTDCWTAINGGVYDVTSWISKHPGGEKAIIGICGKDASQLFKNQHEGQEKPEAKLISFKIGDLKN